MKCTNCGFDAQNASICPICGEKLAPEQPVIQPQQNGGANPAQPGEINPYAQSAAPRQPAAPQPQGFARQPVNPQPPVKPQPQGFAQPPVNPQPPAAVPMPEDPAKNGKIAAIVIGSIVGLVVLTGIVIAVISATAFRGSVFRDQASELQGELYEPSVIDDSEILFEDRLFEIGSPYDFGHGTICLKNVELVKTQTNGSRQYAFTVEIVNNTDKVQKYLGTLPTFYSENEKSAAIDRSLIDMEFLYSEPEYYENGIILSPGEKAELVYYFRNSGGDSVFTANVEVSDPDYAYTASANYKADLGKAKATKDEPK